MRVVSCSFTDTGLKRQANEDSFLVDEDVPLFVVADGMGGHRGGAVASALAVEFVGVAMRRVLVPPDAKLGPLGVRPVPDILADQLAYAIRVAGRQIHDASVTIPEVASMGTTCVALSFAKNRAVVANVGDSRAYCVRSGKIEQITLDHSVVAEYVRKGMITEDQAKQHLFKSALTRSVGFEEETLVDTFQRPVEKSDVFVLCSDGLSNMVTDDEIRAICGENDPDAAAEALVELANQRGGDDNITVVVARVDELDDEYAE